MFRSAPTSGRLDRARRGRPRIRTKPLVVLACALAVVAAPATADAAPRIPDQGMYDSCDPVTSRDQCVSRLRKLSGAGFKVVMKMGGVTPVQLPQLLLYAHAANSLGMKVIWQLRDGLADASLVTVVAALRVLPATWGYYIFDEPGAAQRDRVATFNARVKALDPTHQRLIMGCGGCYGGDGSVNFLAGIDATLGSDIYPVAEQAPDQPGVARRVAAVASGLQRVADQEGRKTVMALQAWRWGDSHYDSLATGIGQASRFPTRKEIEDQRNAAVTSGRPDLILWFTLNQVIGWEPGQRPWYWQQPADPAQRWANLIGGAFARPGGPAVNKRPVARFTLRARRVGKGARASANGTKRVMVDAGRSYDPDGRIVRYRWYASGQRHAVCVRRRCSLKLRRASQRRVKLFVIDNHGARSSLVRRIGGRAR